MCIRDSRYLSTNTKIDKSGQFGMNDVSYQKMLAMLQNPHGIIYFTGPTGSGKTTTLYMILEYLTQKNVNISTIEDPVERNIPRVNPVSYTHLDVYKRQDPYCTFLFTVSGSLDLMHLLRSISNEAWADAVNKDLPILLISGDMDPVGDYGKGVAKVRDLLKAAGVKDLQMTLYPQGRHEILNEIDRQVVYSDVATWLEGHLPKEEK